MYDDLCIISGTIGKQMTEGVCAGLSVQPAKRRVARFKDGEIDVQLLENVRGKDVYIVNPTCPPAENKDELILLTSAACDSSAGRITLVIPYLGYNRQDRKAAPRVPVSAQVMINQLKAAGADRALLLDVHSEATIPHFKPHMRTDHLYASWVAIPYLKQLLAGEFTVVSPDAGGVARVRKYAQHLGVRRLAVFLKFRPKPGEVAEDETIAVGDIEGQDLVFIDDIIDSGGTLIANGKLAKSRGAKDIYAFATHGLFSNNALEKFRDGPFKEIIVTDSVGNLKPGSQMLGTTKLTVLSVAPLLSAAIQRLHHNKSLSDLILG